MALLAVAWVDPDAREDVGTLIVTRMLAVAKAFQSRVVTIMGSLCRITLACPRLAEDFIGLARQVLSVVEQQDSAVGADDEDGDVAAASSTATATAEES
ncbi:MAG TPA: hypothetical protein VGX23_37960 [Actinocrinis sp.]|nr:hypothetical protein [Actinocrinis sp.]